MKQKLFTLIGAYGKYGLAKKLKMSYPTFILKFEDNNKFTLGEVESIEKLHSDLLND